MSDAELLARTGGTGTATRWRDRAVAVVLLLVLGVLAGSAPTSGGSLDPEGTAPGGLRGVLDVLRTLDVTVDLRDADDPGATPASGDTVLLLPGTPPDEAAALVAPGVRVVSTTPPPDAGEALVGLGVGGLGVVRLPVDCALLADTTVLASGEWVGWDRPTDGQDACVAVGDGAWLVADGARADGQHVHLATLDPLVNARLDGTDAGLAAVRLLEPEGDGRVLVLYPPPPEATLLDLVPGRVWDALLVGLGAVALLAAARGRRLGTPPEERLPVRVPGGELVRALGDLRTRADQPGATAAALRRHTLQVLRRAHRLPADADVAQVLDAHRAAGAVLPAGADVVLGGPLPGDDETLLRHADALARLRAATAPGADAATLPPTSTRDGAHEPGDPTRDPTHDPTHDRTDPTDHRDDRSEP